MQNLCHTQTFYLCGDLLSSPNARNDTAINHISIESTWLAENIPQSKICTLIIYWRYNTDIGRSNLTQHLKKVRKKQKRNIKLTEALYINDQITR